MALNPATASSKLECKVSIPSMAILDPFLAYKANLLLENTVYSLVAGLQKATNIG